MINGVYIVDNKKLVNTQISEHWHDAVGDLFVLVPKINFGIVNFVFPSRRGEGGNFLGTEFLKGLHGVDLGVYISQ